jgi:hypothetical protein
MYLWGPLAARSEVFARGPDSNEGCEEMGETTAPPIDNTGGNFGVRLSGIENALKLDDRIKSIEAALASKLDASGKTPPWWRNRTTVTVLGALIAAILPVVSAINGFWQNRRDYQRAVIEQQDKIRQTYLDRVLRTGISEGEQERIFGLLAKLKSDPELQEWAREQRDRATKEVEDLKERESNQEARNKELEGQIEKLSQDAALAGQARARTGSELHRLQGALAEGQQRTSELRERVGEPSGGSPGQVGSPGQIRLLRGRVNSPMGEPISHAQVTAVSGDMAVHSVSDDAGFFSLELPSSFARGRMIPRGTFQLYVEDGTAWLPTSVPVAIGSSKDTILHIVMSPASKKPVS